MGARVQVKVISDWENDPSVYLYAHWGAGGPTKHAVARAFKEGRRSDFEYLARAIFARMIEDELLDSLGYGIGTSIHGDIEELVVVDTKNRKVFFYEGFDHDKLNAIDKGDYTFAEEFSFDEFAKTAIGG